MLASVLVLVAAAIIGVLGVLHLIITYRGERLYPRNRAMVEVLRREHLVVTRQTTFWRAWLGFNASHSLGAILFAGVYGYLAWCRREVLLDDAFLMLLGQATLLTYLVLAVRYWFRIPLIGIALANLAFATGWILARIA